MTTLTAPLAVAPLQVGGLTLEQRLDRTWAEVRAEGQADCPVCGGQMAQAGDGGDCSACGCRLS
jgi:tRNA(Ile2) C34 agmatinyltransferase TiaS